MKDSTFPNRRCFVAVSLGTLFAVLILGLAGCSHKKTNRGHLFRCDWAFEYNRTPWVGCPPDSGCDDERGCNVDGGCGGCRKKGLFDAFSPDSGCRCDDSGNKGFRRYCGVYPGCNAKKPCCRSLGCGMWVDANTFAGLNGAPKSCGLTPFCSPMKPCGLTPMCGRVTAAMVAQPPLMLGNGGMVSPQPVLPTPAAPKKTSDPAPEKEKKAPTVAGPNGMLISMGIVPGVSTVTTGGVVAAAGVATPVGVMTPSGVQLPNGMLHHQAVIKACVLHPGCTAARPCGLSPGCGMMVPVAMVSNNAMRLASALTAPGVSGNVMQAGGMYAPSMGYVNGNLMQTGGIPVGRVGGQMLTNPVAGMPVSGLTMSGGPQTGYPPIGYAPTGYSPGYAQFDELGLAMGLRNPEATEDKEEPEPEPEPETRSRMSVPRFHPVPSKPAFQRSEGLPTTPRVKQVSLKRIAAGEDVLEEAEYDAAAASGLAGKPSPRREVATGDRADREALEEAYLEGMSTAMQEIEAELDAREEEWTDSPNREKVLRQAARLQAKIDARQQREERLYEENLEQMQYLERQAKLQARRQAEIQAREAEALQRQLQQVQWLRQIQHQQGKQLASKEARPGSAARQNVAAKSGAGRTEPSQSAVGKILSPIRELWASNALNFENVQGDKVVKNPRTPNRVNRNSSTRPPTAIAANQQPSRHLAQSTQLVADVPIRPPTFAGRPNKTSSEDWEPEFQFEVQQAHYVDRD